MAFDGPLAATSTMRELVFKARSKVGTSAAQRSNNPRNGLGEERSEDSPRTASQDSSIPRRKVIPMFRFRRKPVNKRHEQRSAVTRRHLGVVLATSMVAGVFGASATPGASAPIQQGFELAASDLRFILTQIKIAERHVATTTAETGPCGAMFGPDADQIPAGGVGITLPWGLRTVSGSCNNIVEGQDKYGTAGEPMPRIVPAQWRDSYPITQAGPMIMDRSPRVISNLIVDQSVNNPSAVTVNAGAPTIDEEGTFFIGNATPDGGISAAYNSWFTLFGQFFDHGLDLTSKSSAAGTVMINLNPDDALYNPTPGARTNVMFLTRSAKTAEGDAINQTSSFVDQSQTYASHPSHQVFLREYQLVGGVPVTTGSLVKGPGDGMANWAALKSQARNILGIELVDSDVSAVPLVVTDPYGNFVPGPNGFPQLVMSEDGTMLSEGALPVLDGAATTTTGAQRTGGAFLDDIAHHATPTGTPDADTLASPGADGSPYEDDHIRSTYDNEMLDTHYVAGDGRANENIGLTTVHHVFHSEHNRLAEEIQTMIETDRAFTGAERSEWQTFNPASGFSYTERVFQAAKLVTEMEYQHLVFEEFARKVQPAINLFGEGGTGYQTDLDPRIMAEFAHAVYRFGHSMLNETLERTNGEGVKDSMLLLDAFLNPPRFFDGETSAAEAAGNIIRGMGRQVGNELDEFVTEALRNDLVGLPLDLAALNITRGREAGVPTMNNMRRALYNRTFDFGLAPYSNWLDFGSAMRNESSLVNFVAAYGTHSTIVGTTEVAGKRAAATALFTLAATPVADPGADGTAEEMAAFAAYDDALNFLRSSGSWANVGTASSTGLDDVDLWMGGMAEAPMVGGGLLGPTFNHVFETQMESLQDADRFYYLSRMSGLNLLTQLEGNSFAELIMRNTDVQGLPADTFSTPAYVFDLAAQELTGPIVDDPATEWDERTLLTRDLDGTIRYSGEEHVYFQGTALGNGIRSGLGDDTVRGNDGDDRIEGGDGNDHLLGGVGDDIITDFFGVEMIKGGPGDDTISSGRGGGDLNFGGDGKDFIIGGNDATESFGGPGDDFIFAGDDLDTVFGDEGNDWIEGGRGPFNLLQGDTGAPFQDDPIDSGDDVIFGWGGEQDYDAEGGDDIMFIGPGIQRAEGMRGFDWAIHRSDPIAADSDMAISVLLPPAVFTNRDRMDLVEGLSGWQYNDILRGDNRVTADFIDNVLTDAGADKISGLNVLERAIPGGIPFNDGNILLGGAGSDLIEGRGGNDVIDGDRWLNAVLTAPDPSTPVANDRIEHNFLTSLRVDVLSGAIDPGSIGIIRRIETPEPDASVDTALFSDVQANYVITKNFTSGVVTVQHVGLRPTDGTDTLLNIERLRFADGEVQLAVMFNTAATGDVTIDNLTPTENETLTATATVSDAEGIGLGGVEIVWEMQVAPGVWEGIGGGATLLLTDLHVGMQLRAIAVFEDGVGVPEQVTGTSVTAPVINVNDLPVGEPSLSHAATVSPEAGSPVSVDLTPVTDEDGIPSTVTVQWTQTGTLGTGDYTAIPGATGTTFTPLLAQEGRRLKVTYTYTDLHGTVETVLSNETDRVIVVARPELSAPAVTDFGLRAVGAAFPQRLITVTNVGTSPLTVNGTTVGGTDAALFTVLPGGCPAPVLPTESCTITVAFATDSVVGAKTATLTLASNDLRGPITVGLTGALMANTLPTGIPVVDDITPIETQTLVASAASVADVDGLTNATFSYTWQQSALGGAGVITDIAGATGPTLTLAQAQVNRRVRVVVTFTDDLGSLQSVISALTGIVGDTFIGTATNETLLGTIVDDVLRGGGGNDTLDGNTGNDVLSGDAGDDTLAGGVGNDFFEVSGTGDGFDAVNGGTGTDVIRAMANGTSIGLRSVTAVESITANGFTNVSIWGSALADTLNLSAVTLVGITSINGGFGNDIMSGSAASDRINGGAGNDTLTGNAGADTIRGGGGIDASTPGTGNDIIAAGLGDSGTHTVVGFDANPTGGQDVVDVRSMGVTVANFATAVVRTHVGADTRITIGAMVILLRGVNVTTVTSQDFIL